MPLSNIIGYLVKKYVLNSYDFKSRRKDFNINIFSVILM